MKIGLWNDERSIVVFLMKNDITNHTIKSIRVEFKNGECANLDKPIVITESD